MENFFSSDRKRITVSPDKEKDGEKRPVHYLFHSKNSKIGDFPEFLKFNQKLRPLGDRTENFSDFSDLSVHNGQNKIPGSLERQKRKAESHIEGEGGLVRTNGTSDLEINPNRPMGQLPNSQLGPRIGRGHK